VYQFVNRVSGRKYYGITKNIHTRTSAHKSAAKRGAKSPFYCSVRKYGWECFELSILHSNLPQEDASKLEIALIATDDRCYNLHLGGKIGFDIRLLPEERLRSLKEKLRAGRKDRKPALGMKHTELNRKLFADVSRKYWDSQETYTWEDIKNLSFQKASKQFGISKTHYYRLRKRHGTNDSM
jgi:group I intron endonuclease